MENRSLLLACLITAGYLQKTPYPYLLLFAGFLMMQAGDI